jgi:PAS domain S-box-containing protein
MEWQNIPYMILLSISGVGTAVLALYVWWKRRLVPEARSLTLLMVAVAVWSLTYMMELGSTEFAAKVFWLRVEYLGIVTFPTAWLCFAVQFTGRDTWLRPRNLMLLALEPLIMLALVWSNSVHHLFWDSLTLNGGRSFSAVVLDRGVGAWFHVAYSYLLLLVGSLLIVETLVRSSYLYRRQASVMILALLAPWVGNVMYITGWNPFPDLDLTPFGFTITCGAWVWGLFRFRLLDIMPIAREAIFENIGDAVIVLDAQNRLVDFNPAAERILDITVPKAIGQPIELVFSGWPELLEHCREEADASAAIFKGKGEAQQFFDVRISPLYDRRGTVAGRLALLHDLTDYRQMELHLNQASKLAAIGELAAGVAHEINNPLGAIDVHTGLMRDILEEKGNKISNTVRAELEDCCRVVEEQIQKCHSITRDLLSFARMPVAEPETFQINALLRKTVGLVTKLTNKKVNVEVMLNDRIPDFNGDADQLEQVFVNILTNAIKATRENDLISVETRMEDEEHIVIEFKDSGVGIDPDIKDRIFDPFFTTGSEGEGTGLGLSISYYIIKQMDGEIQAESIPGKGSTFRVILPSTDNTH